MAQYKNGISIDGIYFDIPFVSIKRNAEFLDKFAERVESGDLLRELIGVYINYSMTFGIIDDEDLYESLWNKLTEPVEFHTFVFPTIKGNTEFVAYPTGVSDEAIIVLTNSCQFSGLTCDFISKKPTRK